MDAALRIVLLCLLLVLSGCFRTVIQYTPQRGPHQTYQVRSGDTLSSIARRYHLDYQVLARRNHLRSPYLIYVGQHLSLWSEAPRASYMPTNTASPKPRIKSDFKAPSRVKKSAKRVAKRTPGKSGAVSLRWPLDGKVTSRFGRRQGRPHDGVDIGAKEGTPVHAAAAGEVVYADNRPSGYGNLIIVRHSHDMFTAYTHNQRNLVSKGARVQQGDIIARVGHTGRASGSHLHFEVRRGPTPVDPQAYLPRR